MVSHVTQDPNFGLRHVSARVLDQDTAYALFTITREGVIAGTVVTAQSTYRILPISNAEQAVFRVPNVNARAARLTGGTEVAETKLIDGLELRHRQALKAAELQPGMLRVGQKGSKLFIRGGKLGTVRGPLRDEDLKRIISSLGALTVANEHEVDLRVTRQTGSRIQLTQFIRNIPVEARNEFLLSGSGDVSEISLSVLDPALAPKGARISAKTALALAAHAYQRRVSRATSEVEFSHSPSLRLIPVPGEGTLALVYRFLTFSKNGPAFITSVNAISQEVVFEESQRGVTGELYRAEPNTSPRQSGDPGATLVYDTNGNCMLGDFVACLPYLGPSITTSVIFGELERAASPEPDVCCDLLGGNHPDNPTPSDGQIDIILGTGATPHYGAYDSWSGNILFSDFGSHLAENSDTIAHELCHHYHAMYGPRMGNEPFEMALQEGLADACAGALAESYNEGNPPAGYGIDMALMGERWVFGDGNASDPAIVRDMRVPRQLSYIENTLNSTTPPNTHEAGKAVSNLFYRLWQKGGIVPERLVTLVLSTMQHLDDWELDGVDLDDFHEALMRATRPWESALRANVNLAWQEMGEAIPSPPPSNPPDFPPAFPGTGVPSAPAFVNASFSGCDVGFTWHLVSWSSVWNAGNYRGWLANPIGQYSLAAIFPSTQTSEYAYSNFNTSAKIQACNADGCSSLSTSTAQLPYNPSCSNW